jgi:hypothetical protein
MLLLAKHIQYIWDKNNSHATMNCRMNKNMKIMFIFNDLWINGSILCVNVHSFDKICILLSLINFISSLHIYRILACWDIAIKKTMIPMMALKHYWLQNKLFNLHRHNIHNGILRFFCRRIKVSFRYDGKILCRVFFRPLFIPNSIVVKRIQSLDSRR